MSSADFVPSSYARPLSDAAIEELRRAVDAHVHQRQADADLRAVVRLLCAEIHRKNLHAEQLIIAFKEAWNSLPEVRQLPRGGPRERLLDQAITMCVEEFYARET